MPIADLHRDAARYLHETRLGNVTDADGRRWLEIPGHVGSVIAAHRPTRDPFEIRLAPHPNTKFYEETTTLLLSFLLTRLRPKVFFDIGASIGHFSLVAASHLAAHPDVHAFEIQPPRIKKLEQVADRVVLTGKITCHLAGLSDVHSGNKRIWYARTKMFEYEPSPSEYREAWWRRLKFAIQGNKKRDLYSAEVLLTALDRFCSERGLVPDLMKIDVDGYEGKVLRGARRILDSVQPVILLELHKDALQRDGILRYNVVALLFEAGYQALFVTDHQRLAKCRLVQADFGHPLFVRQETDMVLFIPARLAN